MHDLINVICSKRISISRVGEFFFFSFLSKWFSVEQFWQKKNMAPKENELFHW